MTENYSVEQKRPSAVPYVLGGAAAGGLGGYYGLRNSSLVSSPGKYKSHEDLINEAEDEFVKKLNTAEGSDKTVMEKAKEIRDKAAKAGEDWQKEFDAFKASKTPELPADHALLAERAQLEEAKTAAQKALDEKIAALEKAEAEKLAKAATPAQGNPKAIASLQAKIAQAEAEVTRAQTQLNTLADTWAGKLAHTSGKNAEQTVAQAEAAIRAQVNGIKGITPEQKEKLIKEVLEDLGSRGSIAERIAIQKEAVAQAEHNLNANMKNVLRNSGLTGEAKIEKVQTLLNGQEKKLTKLEAERRKHIQDMWNQRKAVRKYNADSVKTVKQTVIENGQKVEREVITELRPKKTFNFEPYGKRNDVMALRKDVAAKKKIIAQADDLAKEQAKLVELVGQKTEFVVPEGKKLAGLKKSLAQQTGGSTGVVEDVAAKAKEIVAKDPSKYATESKALKEAADKVDDVAKRISEEVGKLGGAVDEKALADEFAKSGKGTKMEAMKKAAGEVKDDVANVFKKVNTNKLIGFTAAAAVAGIVLASMLRPKAKETKQA